MESEAGASKTDLTSSLQKHNLTILKSEIPVIAAGAATSSEDMMMMMKMEERAAFIKKLKIGDRSGVNYEMPLQPEKSKNGHVYRPTPLSATTHDEPIMF